MSLTLKWKGREFNRKLSRATAAGLKRAAAFYHAKCRKAVSEPNTGTRRTRKRTTVAGKKGSTYTTYDNPSARGQPPRLRTGTGRGEIVWEYNGNDRRPAVRIGVTKKGIYMAYLDLGTRRIAPRPWLRATLERFRAVIARLAATGGKREVGG